MTMAVEEIRVRAVLKYQRTSAYKVRQVLNEIRGMPATEALDMLQLLNREAGRIVHKVLKSAVANAEAAGLDGDELYVNTTFADEGMTVKRFRPRARGRATKIRKRTCHVTVEVSPMSQDRLKIVRAKRQRSESLNRQRRVLGQRRKDDLMQIDGAEAKDLDQISDKDSDVDENTIEDLDTSEFDGSTDLKDLEGETSLSTEHNLESSSTETLIEQTVDEESEPSETIDLEEEKQDKEP